MNYTLLPQGEKDSLDNPQRRPRHRNSSRLLRNSLLVISATVSIYLIYQLSTLTNYLSFSKNDLRAYGIEDQQTLLSEETCPQFPAIEYDVDTSRLKEVMKGLEKIWESEEFKKESVERMKGAIGVPTMSFDDMGDIGTDERWEIFVKFHQFLEETFPLIHEKLEVTKVNTHGLVFEWKGSDSTLKPYLLMAHQDVVPVPQETVDRWTYPPFSGHFDGKFIWGRGSSDCKNNLIGIMEALETLLADEWQPKRTIIAAFGFDEEISGGRGAKHISEHLLEKWGPDSLELLVDEGGMGISDFYGKKFAMPGLGEKGYVDVRIVVETEGGHSSVPPDHTGIGILSKIISMLEDHPYSPDLTPVNPFFTTLQCSAEHSPDLSPFLRSSIKAAAKSKVAAKALALHIAGTSKSQRYLMQTSQAADLISGGLKINALPEKVAAVVNHRVAVESNVTEVTNRLTHIIQMSIAQRYGFEVVAFGELLENPIGNDTSTGRITLEYFEEPLEPAPVSPLDTEAYKIFSGTIKQALGDDIIVSPSIMTGNTDTKFMWKLTRNIYRFSPVEEGGRFNAHTVDERISIKSHLDGVRFYSALILNGNL